MEIIVNERQKYVLDGLSEGIQGELASFIEYRRKKVKASTWAEDILKVNVLRRFLVEKHEGMDSFREIKKQNLIREYTVFLGAKGYQIYKKRARRDRDNGFTEESEKIAYLRWIYDYLENGGKERLFSFMDDKWDIRLLDYPPRINAANPRYTLDFTRIKQDEMKHDVKDIAFIHAAWSAKGTLSIKLTGIGVFSEFLAERYPEVKSWNEITREVIEEYEAYMNLETNYAPRTKRIYIEALRWFFLELYARNNNENLLYLIQKSDTYYNPKILPKPYSEAEILAFNRMLLFLPVQLARCMTLHQLLGLRISDTLLLKMDCLRDFRGETYIGIQQLKTHYFERPISREIEDLVKASIEYSKQLGNKVYVFSDGGDKPYSYSKVQYQINAKIREVGVVGDDGEWFKFETHRFRDTFATRMSAMGFADEEISLLLGHADDRSIKHYRELSLYQLAEKTKPITDQYEALMRKYGRGGEKDGQL